MNVLRPYKGFQGSVEYDDGVLFIKILHIDDSITTACENATDVVSNFHELVDDYIETCRELGEEPNRPFKGSFNIRIEPSLHRAAAFSASSIRTTLNRWVETAIRERIQRESIDYDVISKESYFERSELYSENVMIFVQSSEISPQEERDTHKKLTAEIYDIRSLKKTRAG